MGVQVLTSNELFALFKEMFEQYEEVKYTRRKNKGEPWDFPGFRYVKWKSIETFRQENEWGAKARYFCYFEDDVLLGVNKVFLEHGPDRYPNETRIKMGLPPIEGRTWGHAFVDVHEEGRKKGIARKLYDAMLFLMKPGDLFTSTSYSPEGQAFTLAWVKSHRGDINLCFTDYLSDYDPTKINFSLNLSESHFAHKLACLKLGEMFR